MKLPLWNKENRRVAEIAAISGNLHFYQGHPT